MIVTIGHTPDSDDAFMFSALTEGRINTRGMKVRLVIKDIETLNRWAMKGRLEATAISFHAYAYVHNIYALLPCGASFGNKYGPILVAKKIQPRKELKKHTIAIPGIRTSAFLLLRIFLGEFPYMELPFDKIPGAVASGKYAAGLLIHEGQLTYKNLGLIKLMDLGQEWQRATNLPLPLGANAVRKDLSPGSIRAISSLLMRSIQWGMKHRKLAMESALQYARSADEALVNTFVRMYVNRYTLSYGQKGIKAVRTMFRMGWEKGVLPELIEPEFLPNR